MAFRAFRYRNYRLFFFGQGISLIGTWMQSVATNWLVYRLTHSSLYLGIVAFFGQIPVLLLSPFAGVFNDRWNRRIALLIIQFLALSQALVLACVTVTGNAVIWNIIALTFFLGLINSFEMPTRQSLVVELIGDQNDLGNAIALNSTVFNGARLIGPAIAGVLVARYGEGVCFFTNAATYLAAIIMFSMMKNKGMRRESEGKKNIIDELKEGFLYALRFAPIRDLLLLILLLSFVGMSFPVVLPVFAATILGGGSTVYGALVAASGFGAFVATMYLAIRPSVLGLGKIVAIGMFLFGFSLIGFSLIRNLVFSLLLISIAGGSMILNMAACNTIIQTIVEESKRGRVMSMYVMAFMGSAPLGSIFAGYMAKAFSAPVAVFIGGLCVLCGGVLFARRLPNFRSLIQPIYRQKGIYPRGNIQIESPVE
ncbi:MAG: MFS transporter [Spirochaetes bacterium]|nr:MFS transporter [Spirochaetota bacterium]